MGLSALSLGLGFLWCLLDEDMLCWHDRMTRTYLTYSGGGNSALLRRMFNLQGALRDVVDRTLNWQ